MNKICASLLKEKLGGLTEVALIDVRAEGAFAESHLLFAVSVPLDRLELSFAGRLSSTTMSSPASIFAFDWNFLSLAWYLGKTHRLYSAMMAAGGLRSQPSA